MAERLRDRLAGSGGLVVSVHIPKTAGSRFLGALKARYGKRVAVYYGADDPRTHPAARRQPADFDGDMIRSLEADGVRVLHGHFGVRRLLEAVPEPARYWVWLREPIERTVSHYHFLAKRAEHSLHPIGRAIADDGEGLTEFAARPEIGAFQSRYVRPLALSDAGFVGVSEMLVPLLFHEGLVDAPRRANLNADKPLLDRRERRPLVPHLAADIALYSEALSLTMARLRSGEAARAEPLAARLRRRLRG